MSLAKWADTYVIHHWLILWSTYRKSAWVGFEPTTTKVRSDALTDWAIKSWVQDLACIGSLSQIAIWWGRYETFDSKRLKSIKGNLSDEGNK